MGWFKRTRSLSERFPSDRLSFLPIGIGAAVGLLAKSKKADLRTFTHSRFVAGYLLGYPDHLDSIDKDFCGVVRKMLFDAFYGGADGPEMFRKAMGHFLLHDDQTRKGWGAGVPDGQQYFDALDRQTKATGSYDSLNELFKLGIVDLSQQLD
ncbi:MAG: hypothetical protein ABIT16_04370 [Croceibacterium sp.]